MRKVVFFVNDKKFVMTEEIIDFEGYVIHRIEALRDFELSNGKMVHAGDLGGWIENEENLSHEGNCWVMGNAKIFGDARVRDNALVSMDAEVSGNAICEENCTVRGLCRINTNAYVSGSADIYGRTVITDEAIICGEASVGGHAFIHIGKNAHIGGKARIWGEVRIGKNADITGDYQYLTINIGKTSNYSLTLYRGKANSVYIHYGYKSFPVDDEEEFNALIPENVTEKDRAVIASMIQFGKAVIR